MALSSADFRALAHFLGPPFNEDQISVIFRDHLFDRFKVPELNAVIKYLKSLPAFATNPYLKMKGLLPLCSLAHHTHICPVLLTLVDAGSAWNRQEERFGRLDQRRLALCELQSTAASGVCVSLVCQFLVRCLAVRDLHGCLVSACRRSFSLTIRGPSSAMSLLPPQNPYNRPLPPPRPFTPSMSQPWNSSVPSMSGLARNSARPPEQSLALSFTHLSKLPQFKKDRNPYHEVCTLICSLGSHNT